MHRIRFRLFSHDSKVSNLNLNLKCAFELKFERRYFGPCVRQITSRCIIWNPHFKWQSRGVFQLSISQIMQRNHCMNALTSKSWLGGRANWPSTTSAYNTARCTCYRSTGNVNSTAIGRVPRPSHASSPRSRTQNRKFGLSCVHCIIQISQLLRTLVCTLRNSNAHFELK